MSAIIKTGRSAKSVQLPLCGPSGPSPQLLECPVAAHFITRIGKTKCASSGSISGISDASLQSPLKVEGVELNIRQRLAENEWKGEIGFTIESREPERVVARMPVTEAAKNPFGTMHAGALIWFADIAATLCAIGDLDSIGEDGSGFPLAVDLHTVLSGNEKAGDLIATSTTVKRGGKLIVIRTEVRGETGRLLIDMTTTHLRAG